MAATDRSEDARLKDLLDRLVATYRPEAVYLFGSRAEARAGEDSDYDLLVVVPDDTPPERLSLVAAHEAVRETRVPADVIPCRRMVFEARKTEVGTLPYTVWTQGVQVYGA